MTANLDDDFALEKTIKDASKAFTPPEGLKQRMRAALLAGAPDAGIAKTTRGRTWLWQCVGAAAAACVLVSLAVWMIERSENRRERIRQGHEAIIVVQQPRPVTESADLPRASGISYYRAWMESPDALDQMLSRDNAYLLRPELNQSDADVWRLFETVNPIKEEHHEKHSMRDGVPGVLV